MSTTLSFLYQATDRIRAYMDMASLDGKFNDTWIVRHLLMPASRDLVGRMNNNMMNTRIIEEFDVAIVEDTERYLLPPGLRHVLGLMKLNDDGTISEDHHPSNFFDRVGSWRVEGTNGRPYLWIDKTNPNINKTRTMRVYYVGLQDFEWHYGDGGSNSNTTNGFLLETTPTMGVLDLRQYAYVGGMLRVFNPETASGAQTLVMECPISAYDPTTRVVTSRFTYAQIIGAALEGQASYAYEVVPSYGGTFMDAVTAGAILKAANLLKFPSSQKRDLEMEYKSARKTLIDDIGDLNLRVPAYIRRDTRDRLTETAGQMRWDTP